MGIYASREFVARHGKPRSADDLGRFDVIELADEWKGYGRTMDAGACERRHGRCSLRQRAQRAFFEFCQIELKPVLLTGAMRSECGLVPHRRADA